MFKNAKIIGAGVNSEEYHNQKVEDRGKADFWMSPSQLKEFARCPRRWIDGYEMPESKAKDNGNLFDCLLLTPAQFEQRYRVKPETYKDEKSGTMKPWNGNSTVCKEWVADHSDYHVISLDEQNDVLSAIARLRKDEVIVAFLDASDKQVLVQAEWHDPATKLIVPVRCLMDLVPKADSEFSKCLGDVKTTRSAGLSAFTRDVHKLGYHVQAAFDLDIYTAATKEDRTDWCFILGESFKPWQPAKRLLSGDFLAIGRADYTSALTSYCLCRKHGHFPDYDETDEAVQGWSIVQPEPWMGSEGQFKPKMELPQQAVDNDEPPSDDLHATA